MHVIESGRREVIKMPVEQFGLYRLRYEVHCAAQAYWFADFYNSAGQMNYADNYGGIDACPDWTPGESVFMARAEAVEARIGLHALDAPIHFRNIIVEHVDAEKARHWQDGIAQIVPPLPPSASPELNGSLHGLAELLRKGGTVRWVGLGDSLSNDTLNGHPHLFVQRAFPGLTIQLIHGNGPEKFCTNYQKAEVLQRLVFKHRPHFMTVGGASHRGDIPAIVSIVRQTRAACGQIPVLYFDAAVSDETDEIKQGRLKFVAGLRKEAEREKFAVADITEAWWNYAAGCGRPLDWFRRDACHGNDKAKYILARLLAACLTR